MSRMILIALFLAFMAQQAATALEAISRLPL